MSDFASRSPVDPGQLDGGPLTGLRVVEFGQLLAGPHTGMLLGDFGAEVIKVEAPGSGDAMRDWGRLRHNGHSLWWSIAGRNKRSVALDLRTDEGQENAIALCETADVVLENFRPGTLERWDLGYDRLATVNPALIMIRVSGFGQTGPYAARAGYGAIGEAMGGLRYVCGDPSSPPSRMGISIGDSLAATFACIGALAALHHRERTGQGQVVDSAIYEAVLAMMESLVTEYDQAGYVRERTGAILPNVAPSNIYPTADGKMLLIAANQDTVFRRLAEAMQRPELADDDRYATHSARGRHQQTLDELIAEWTKTLPLDELSAMLEQHGVPCGGIYRAPEMLEDAQFAARSAIVRVMHPKFGELAMQNAVPKLSRTPGGIRHVGPELGEHNEEVLGGLLGIDEQQRIELARSGVI